MPLSQICSWRDLKDPYIHVTQIHSWSTLKGINTTRGSPSLLHQAPLVMWDKKEDMNDIWDKIDGLIMMKEFIEMNDSNVSRERSQRAQLHWYGRIACVPSLYLHPNRTEIT